MNQNINVDLIPKFAVYGNLYFSQYDVGREAIINLVNGSTEYEIPSGATVTLVATKPSGLGFTQNCTFEGNQITVVCTAEMTDEAGHFPCEIRIANGSLLLGTANFTFNVERSPHPEGTTDGTADSVISQITVAFETAMDNIEHSGGLTSAIKNAILNCFQKVAWIDQNGQTYYNALSDAFFAVTNITLNASSLLFNSIGSTQQLTATLVPSDSTAQVQWESSDTSVATVSSSGLVTSVADGNATITASVGEVSATCSVSVVEVTVESLNAVLNASGHTFYAGDDINDIKPYLTVTATYSDSTTATIPSGSYTLSGSLVAGENTITVSYEGVSTTVTVTAVASVLTSISAVYTQSGTVYATDTLDSLKSDLVVTATYSDSSTETVPSADYTLSGTLAVGTSTITVTYQEMTATFSVVVTENDGVADGIYTPSEVIRGQYIDNTGTIQSGTQESGYFADFIPLGSKTYVVRYTNPPAYANINWRISEYDENQNFIQQTQYAASTGNRNIAVQIPISQTTKYIRLGWYNPNQTSFVPVFEFYSNTEALPMTIGNIDGSTGQDSSSNTRIRSDYIEASGTMTVSGQPFTFEQYDGYLFRCYDSSKAFVGSLTNNGGVFTTDIQNLSLPTGTAYVRLMYSRNTTHAFTIGWGSMIQNPITINGDKYWLTEVFS